MSLRVTPDHYFVLAISVAVLGHVLLPLRQIIPRQFWLIGLLIVIAGFLISRRANAILAKHQTSIKPFESPAVFISSGPFRLSRNPVYLGMTLMLFGIALSLGSITPFVFPILFAVVISVFVIPDEERELEKKFKNEYFQYKRKVRRWI